MMPAATRLVTVVVCGLLYGLCFPPFRLHALAWIVLVPALVALRSAGRFEALWLAAALATAGTVATVHWLPHTVATFFHQPWALGTAMLGGVALVMVVPPYVFAALGYRVLAVKPRWWLPLGAAAAWVVGEYVRAHLWTGNPWVLVGYSQAPVTRLVQIADVTSVYGVSFALIAVNVALAELWIGWRRSHRLTPACLGGLGVALATVGFLSAYGTWRLTAAAIGMPGDSPVNVGIVQGNLDLGSQWQGEFYGKNLDQYLHMTVNLLRHSKARLVVWPETAMTFFLEREPLYQASISTFLQPFGAQLLAGGVRVSDTEPPVYYNSAFVIGPEGLPQARYDKQRLLPFAEYFPLPQIDVLRRDFGRVREFTPGRPTQPLPTVAGDAGVLICNEAFFPEIARERVRAGATLLVNLTNDTWVGDETFSLIAFDMSRFRAIEQRRFLVRASTAGPSAIVDPYGRVTVQTPLFAAATCAGSVRPVLVTTAYARLGDVFVAACAVLTAGLVLTRLRRASRKFGARSRMREEGKMVARDPA
jgi:apolipoprotein N-acyltransferase